MNRQPTSVPHLSWSQVQTYTQCPAKWWFSRHCPPESVPSALKFGSAVHETLASYFTARQEGASLGLEELLATYEGRWAKEEEAPITFASGESEETLRAMAERMVAAFLESWAPSEIVAVEQGFTVPLSESLVVTGSVDLIEYRDGQFWIVDFKTSKGEPSAAFDKEQVALYRIGMEKLGVIPEGSRVGLRYDVLRKLKTRSECVSVSVEVTARDLEELHEKLHQVAFAMRQGVLYRVRSWACASCPYRQTCATTELPACPEPAREAA